MTTQHALPSDLIERVKSAPNEQVFTTGMSELCRHRAIEAIEAIRKLDPDNPQSFTPDVWVSVAGQASQLAASAAVVAEYGVRR